MFSYLIHKIDYGYFKSCTLERIKMLNWHKQQLELQMEKFGLSHYAVAWIYAVTQKIVMQI